MAFWDRLTGRKAGDGDDVTDEEPGGEGGEEEQPQDPLADLDDETREIAEQYAVRKLAEERTKARQAFQARGLDVSEDYQPVIADPAKVTGWLGVPAPRQEEAPPVVPVAPAAAADEADDGEIPEANYDPQGFAAWLKKRDERRDERLTRVFEQRFEQLAQRQTTMEAQGVTTAQVAQALQTYNPALAHVVDHPDFETFYRDALLQVDRRAWSDPRTLAGLAGMITPMLDQSKQPQQQPRGRDAQGKYIESAGDRAAAMRAGRVQLSPGPDVSGGQQQRQYSDEDRMGMQITGMSAEEWEAASDETGNAYRQFKAKQAARERKR